MNDELRDKVLSILGQMRELSEEARVEVRDRAVAVLREDVKNCKMSEERYLAVLEDMNAILLRV